MRYSYETEKPNIFTQTPEEQIAEIFGRWTVTDLREMSNEDLARGDGLLDKSDKRVKIVESGNVGPIRFWMVESGEKIYEVRRFENFALCSCHDFFFRKTCCRHITVTTKFYCRFCFKNPADFEGACNMCSTLAAPYLKQPSDKKPQLIGGIPI